MTLLVVKLPRNLDVTTMYQFIGAAIANDLTPRSNSINFDFDPLRFIQTEGVSVLTNLIEWLRFHDCHGDFVGLDAGVGAIQYLDDSGFFNAYCGTFLRPNAALRATTFPMRNLACAEAHALIDQELSPWLEAKLNLSRPSLADLRTSIRELFNNIQDHSTMQTGCLHVQWFPNKNRVRISVSDFGIGIPGEVRHVRPDLSDAEALNLALTDGFSSKINGRNMGIGLKDLQRNVVTRNGGMLGIYSNRGKVVCSMDGDVYRRNHGPAQGFYPGTLINIAIRTDRIENLEDIREDLSWL